MNLGKLFPALIRCIFPMEHPVEFKIKNSFKKNIITVIFKVKYSTWIIKIFKKFILYKHIILLQSCCTQNHFSVDL